MDSKCTADVRRKTKAGRGKTKASRRADALDAHFARLARLRASRLAAARAEAARAEKNRYPVKGQRWEYDDEDSDCEVSPDEIEWQMARARFLAKASVAELCEWKLFARGYEETDREEDLTTACQRLLMALRDGKVPAKDIKRHAELAVHVLEHYSDPFSGAHICALRICERCLPDILANKHLAEVARESAAAFVDRHFVTSTGHVCEFTRLGRKIVEACDKVL
jgi:hypothetical protein